MKKEMDSQDLLSFQSSRSQRVPERESGVSEKEAGCARCDG